VSRRSPKKAGLSPSEFETRLADGHIDPLYLFLGPERLLKREAIERLVGTVDEAFRVFNVDTVSAAEREFGEILDLARQVPMMSPRRLVVISHPESIKEGAQDALEEYLKSPSDQAVVVFDADALDQRRKTSTALSKACTVVRFDPLSEAEAIRWVEARARARGVTFDKQAIGALVDLAGADLTRLAVEVDKLVAHAGGRAVGLAAVQALVVRSREHEVWDLTDAIVARDRKRALRVLTRQLDAGEEPLGLLAMLASTYRKMLIAKELMERHAPAAEVQAAVKLRRANCRRHHPDGRGGPRGQELDRHAAPSARGACVRAHALERTKGATTRRVIAP
jgi:DNA polymerase-3 subunit delta